MSTESMIGSYRLLNMMMQGQTSQVWEVVEGSSGRHFALKLLLPETARTPEHRRFLFHEASVGLQFHHPNVIRVIKLVHEKKHDPYIIMEFFPSKNVKLRLMHKETFVRERAHTILQQAVSGLAHINDKGWVHRDVKPDNILVNSSAEVRIIDFALAQRIQKGGLFSWFRRRKKTQGTRSYMSPEQILAKPLDSRADVYSFGCTMYEIVTGRPPFRASSGGELLNKHLKEPPSPPQTYNPDITDECGKLVLRLMAKKREDRPSSFHEVLVALRQLRVFQGDKIERTGRT